MKPVGLLLLVAGWTIVLTAMAILPPVSARAAFMFAGFGVEALGLGLVIRAHIPQVEEKG